MCSGGYQCRAKKCASDPYESCNVNHVPPVISYYYRRPAPGKCRNKMWAIPTDHSSFRKTCPFLTVCAYEATGVNCAVGVCPCYGRYRAKCVFNPDAYFKCGLDTIPIVSSTGIVTCNGCVSATTVLTGP